MSLVVRVDLLCWIIVEFMYGNRCRGVSVNVRQGGGAERMNRKVGQER